MKTYLEKDIFIFSELKGNAQLKNAASFLKDEKGNIRAFSDFQQQIKSLKSDYNESYLEAEYQFAVSSSQSAANWANLQDDSSRYLLKYVTAQDDKVRISHADLNGITLPKNDAFWNNYYPPNGWRCRCHAVEVLARENEESNSSEAEKKGNIATTQLSKDGKNKLEMFRFNPGAEKKVFPPNNSYTKVVGADKIIKK